MFKALHQKLKNEGFFDKTLIDKIDPLFHSLETKKGEVLLRQGETARYLYFINKGCLRVFCVQDDGKESTRFFAFENRFATAFPSFISQQPSSAFIDTVEKSSLLKIHYDDFQSLLRTIPEWERLYRQDLERDYIESIQRIESFVTMNAGERYRRILKNEPHLIQRLPNKILANYMGISQETLSRLKSKD
ncbi:cAMP-binding protein [Fulvivirga imtechensis AK7]|uniref:cAMP-binding protein n=1 Tax=Fulvivirga imtechensis AK7 TaxID=1237149 RepID=L8JNR7_9BACT|nr:cAMP-binding protein [Fulvivirga imtechensis AK7]